MRDVPKAANASQPDPAHLPVADERHARIYRLTHPAEFKYVFDHPCKSSDRDFTVLCRANRLEFPRLGMAVAKKQVKTAVARNRIKRLIRESFRRNHPGLEGMDIVVLVRRGAVRLKNRQILETLEQHWQLIRQQCKS